MIIFDAINLIHNPLVSVGVFTYNQEKYIKQCIDSILNQKTKFDYEIIIGEDCGSDGTRNICLEYQRKYPEKIKLLLHDKNHGMMTNFSEVVKLMRGEYMADMDGDDYWCDEYKLQKQIDYLKENPRYGVCFTAGYTLTIDGNFISHPKSYSPCENGYVRMLAQYGPLGLSSSMVAKTRLFHDIDFDEVIKKELPAEDYVICAIWALTTQFCFMDDKTTVRRVITNSLCHKFIDKKYRQGIIKTRYYLGEKFPNEYQFDLGELEDEWNYLEFKEQFLKGSYKNARKFRTLISHDYAKHKLYCRYFTGPISFLLLKLYIRIHKLTYNPKW